VALLVQICYTFQEKNVYFTITGNQRVLHRDSFLLCMLLL
jgi:hypothetical protein